MMTLKEAPKNIAHALLLPINPAAVIILGLYTTVWGLWLANPFWSVFSQAPLYDVLATVPPDVFPAEFFWGTIAIVCGCIITYGAYKRYYRPLIIGASVATWHWLMIAVFYFWGDWQNTGGITSLMLAVYGAFIYLNVRTNYKDRPRDTYILGP